MAWIISPIRSMYPPSEDDPSVIQASLNALSGRFMTSEWWRDLEFNVQLSL